jgi:cell division protein FtsN
MNTFQLSKNELRVLIAVSILLPLFCFVAGIYTTNNIKQSSVANTPNITTVVQTLPLPAVTTNEETQNTDVSLTSDEVETVIKVDDVVVAEESTPAVTVDKTELKEETPPPSSYYVVQAGLFSHYINANQYQYKLHVKGIDTQILNTEKDGKESYRIVLDIFGSKNDALELLNAIKETQNIDLYVTEIEDSAKVQKVALL